MTKRIIYKNYEIIFVTDQMIILKLNHDCETNYNKKMVIYKDDLKSLYYLIMENKP